MAMTPHLITIPSPTVAPSAARDFDFLMGPWRIRNTRLVRRLAGCNDWEVFDATGHARPLPGGIGNCDDFMPLAWKPGFVGMTLRVFSPAAQRWSIYWLDNATGGLDAATGLLMPPVVGGFDNGVGIFEGQELLDGRPVQVRFEWTQTGTPTPRWQQAFSGDGGATWEVNWVMEFSRPV
ncbi:hypothetical protein [Acidovorax sp. Leaf78]|uniref:hypothetical protein n=1 Tax=unclassified Acidovorax TaxID=2684926 RepID=UPI0006FC4418|nr:hypothetical protein [Acidovorax sp. Leaf78]KQO16786.1 hypothetical protein ASF16_12815 [Acidovorax sp. Leaf78]